MPEVFALLPRRRPWWHLRRTGLFFGAVYVLISMSASLLPRTWYYQGLITGLCWWAGYGLGVLLFWLAHHLARLAGLRVYLSARAIRWLRIGLPALFAVGIATATVANVRAQAHTASVVGLAPLSPLDWALALGLAAVIALSLLAVVRGLRRLRQALTDVVDHVLPKSVSAVLAAVVVVTGTAWVSDNVIFRRAMQVMAASAAQVNADNPSGRPAPTSPLRTGGPGSTEAYATLGFEGQMFVTSAPAESEIAAATGRPALDPIRAYAGRPDERSLTEVAAAVVAELKRTGAFDRKVLAVVTTTGTGWVDDYAVQSIEYLSDGDSATAAMQYSFLPSALQVLTDRDTPRAAGKALFDAVHAEWVRRPATTRPRLVVGGESLGSFGGQGAFTDADDMMARAQGGVWAGTPSFTDIWSNLTSSRSKGSPEIAPVVGDGRHIRFATSGSQLTTDYYGRPYGDWEFPRFVYAQHPSDPVVWWNPALLGSQPAWLREPRGRDVNEDVAWIPFATFWQLTTDMPVAHDTPDGYGHRYGAELVPAWGAVLGGKPGADYSRIVTALKKSVNRVQ